MAYDKVIDSTKLNAELKAIADTIRKKTGKSETINLSQFVNEISSIPIGSDHSTTSNIEIIKGTNDSGIQFQKNTGTVELWGWGKSPTPPGGQEWDRSAYVFVGNKYSLDYIGGPDPIPLTLGIDRLGKMTGIPKINEGEYIGIRKD